MSTYQALMKLLKQRLPRKLLRRQPLQSQWQIWMVIIIVSIDMTCNKFGTPSSPTVARVGNAVLTIDDLSQSIPKEYTNTITQQQRINFIKKWMDTELLYQEALRRNIHKEKAIKMRIEQMKRDLLSAEMITRNIPNLAPDAVSQEALLAYYEQNKNSFIRETDVVKYLEIIVADLKTGWEIRNTITVDNFLAMAAQNSLVPVPDPQKVQYIPVQNLPPELAGILLTLKLNGISTPVKSNDGVHIALLLDRQKAGDVCLLEEVREEIHTILMTQLQKKQIENLLSELKKKNNNEFHFELIMQDSSLLQEPEGGLDELIDSTMKN
ncbi:MAG: peptidyl-prolyl cis-trans isomerase [Chitinivibrionales bacterium]|nr:peptidyl-prolyl cis-trans isomerase [Chitinivibrionales bacterium]